MKKAIALLALPLLCVACQQHAMPHFYKAPNLQNRSVAVPLTNKTVSVNWMGAKSTSYPFLECLKEEMRTRGWTLVAEKVTGRTGEHMDINSAAAFTIFDEETGQGRYKKDGSLQLTMKGTVNLVLVENATGEEVMVLQGYVAHPKGTAKIVVDKLESFRAQQVNP